MITHWTVYRIAPSGRSDYVLPKFEAMMLGWGYEGYKYHNVYTYILVNKLISFFR